MSGGASLFDKRLVVIAGKGGVGRTTVAAALALAAVRLGKRVLLAQTRAKDGLGALLGGPHVGHDIVRLRQGLWAVNMTPRAALREYGLMVLHSTLIYNLVFENRLARAFIRAIPGVEDYSLLGKAWYHTTEQEHGAPKYDMVILDGPATGHIVRLLEMPQVILDSIPDSPLTASAAEARALLVDRRRAEALIVTLAEELPVNETIELAGRLQRDIGIRVEHLVVNQLFPPRFSAGPSAQVLEILNRSTIDQHLTATLERARIAQRRRQLNDRYLERLRQTIDLPQVHLPFLFVPEFAGEAIEDLSIRLEGQLVASTSLD